MEAEDQSGRPQVVGRKSEGEKEENEFVKYLQYILYYFSLKLR